MLTVWIFFSILFVALWVLVVLAMKSEDCLDFNDPEDRALARWWLLAAAFWPLAIIWGVMRAFWLVFLPRKDDDGYSS